MPIPAKENKRVLEALVTAVLGGITFVVSFSGVGLAYDLLRVAAAEKNASDPCTITHGGKEMAGNYHGHPGRIVPLGFRDEYKPGVFTCAASCVPLSFLGVNLGDVVDRDYSPPESLKFLFNCGSHRDEDTACMITHNGMVFDGGNLSEITLEGDNWKTCYVGPKPLP